MTPQSRGEAYPVETFELGSARSGAPVVLAPMSIETAQQLGAATATFGPWRHYGISSAAMTRMFAPAIDNAARYHVHVGRELAGGMVIRDPWLVGPYLQTIAILPAHQGSGIGGRLLAWFEQRARLDSQRNIWLCVSAFNAPAHRFYQAHGWQHAADLADLIRDGDGESLMRKRLTAS